jgi:hypothetical protein
MIKIVLVTLAVGTSLIYANDVATALEHAIKTAPSVESPNVEMSQMKSMGKCGSDK